MMYTTEPVYTHEFKVLRVRVEFSPAAIRNLILAKVREDRPGWEVASDDCEGLEPVEVILEATEPK